MLHLTNSQLSHCKVMTPISSTSTAVTRSHIHVTHSNEPVAETLQWLALPGPTLTATQASESLAHKMRMLLALPVLLLGRFNEPVDLKVLCKVENTTLKLWMMRAESNVGK